MDRAREQLEDSVAAGLAEDDKARVVAMIAAGVAGDDPARRRYRPGREDWLYAASIVAIDTLIVIPVVLPLVLFADKELAVYLSRLVSTAIFAGLGAAYARNLNRNPVLAALVLGALGYAVFTAAYAAGW